MQLSFNKKKNIRKNFGKLKEITGSITGNCGNREIIGNYGKL